MPIRQMVALLAVLTTAVSPAVAQTPTWPDRPVRIIVPFPPGGVPDVLARLLSEKLRPALGQPLVVENRGGVGGNIGTEVVARAPADGYTLTVTASGPLAINPTLYKSLAFDPIADFEPITLLAVVPNVLVVADRFPADSVAKFIEYARNNPGRINYGSIGNGSSQHLAATQFEAVTGIRMTHVPYRAAPQAVADLVGGQIDCMFQLVPNIAQQIKSGQVRALGVTTAKRSQALPEVPTMAELGIKNYDTAGWFGLLAPRGTPRTIVERLNKEVQSLLNESEIRQRIVQYGAEPTTTTPEEFGRFIEAEIGRWRTVVRNSGAKVD